MSDNTVQKTTSPNLSIEYVQEELSINDLNDLCDATDAAINAGGGFGWVKLPARDILERYWQGVIIMPNRDLFISRLDDVICGACQLIHPNTNNEAQSHAVHLTTHFVTPWAREHGLARMLLHRAEKQARATNFTVINLDVRETQDAAIHLYKNEKYTQYATHPAYAYVNDHYVAGQYFMKILDAE